MSISASSEAVPSLAAAHVTLPYLKKFTTLTKLKLSYYMHVPPIVLSKFICSPPTPL